MVGAGDLSADFEPVDEQLVLGWSMSQALEGDGLTYEVGAAYGQASAKPAGVDTDLATFELFGGPRYEWDFDVARVFLAGGVSALSADLEAGQPSVAVDDTSIGAYAGGGVDFALTDALFFGFSLRQSFAHEVTLGGADLDADFTQLLVRIGSSF
jgi:opacity protein-like surface antigen